ncbi:hypothetical protein RclHR1_00930028 [Rhizophagus clarus]|uniref:Uncharacterized protein n=2 Tax=Eukaryota TaxID=2759 RepID=A0AAF0X8S6_DAUCS|nr:hypothetical protein DCAR_0622700 [Daucus carota subsp. sativus]GBC10050.1 hypothetical protein RclHR1_00930028 [Rhizophagus clarus]WOH03306.1 hypothetical protein DCAR_0622702 [Daucus carota subsp. sativus]WOH03308.1 hypothetical protein DCAR_0622704 [Daucus carota subsp. sativus]WOH03310.1 hypothetical protein DCAR_0622706 [Daucus carota subsp. sativus]
MKNVAKCDTWCELQNPVNHRVFERKLRPKPLGPGHVCLGVTHRVAPDQTSPREIYLFRGGNWPPVPFVCGWLKNESLVTGITTSVVVRRPSCVVVYTRRSRELEGPWAQQKLCALRL